MLKSYNRASHITGETGQSLGEETACIFGAMLQLWSYQMGAMDGSDLSWMGSWPQCIPAGVLKEGRTVQVTTLISTSILQMSANCVFVHCFILRCSVLQELPH